MTSTYVDKAWSQHAPTLTLAPVTGTRDMGYIFSPTVTTLEHRCIQQISSIILILVGSSEWLIMTNLGVSEQVGEQVHLGDALQSGPPPVPGAAVLR